MTVRTEFPATALSVIVPALDEEGWIGATLDALRRSVERAAAHGVAPGPASVDVVVVDGGSRDGTEAEARAGSARVIRSRPGRGVQLNAGARAARGDLLLFLHADARLSEDAVTAALRAFRDRALRIATFRRRFDRRHPGLALSARLSSIDSVWTRFGDQGIVVRRAFFDRVGGFPDWPLLEDVQFLRTARRWTGAPVLPATITVSARRFIRTGVVRGQFMNALHLLRHLSGTPAERIAAAYDAGRRRPGD